MCLFFCLSVTPYISISSLSLSLSYILLFLYSFIRNPFCTFILIHNSSFLCEPLYHIYSHSFSPSICLYLYRYLQTQSSLSDSIVSSSITFIVYIFFISVCLYLYLYLLKQFPLSVSNVSSCIYIYSRFISLSVFLYLYRYLLKQSPSFYLVHVSYLFSFFFSLCLFVSLPLLTNAILSF